MTDEKISKISFCERVRNLFKNVSCTSQCCNTKEIVIKEPHKHEHHKHEHHEHHKHGHKRKRSKEIHLDDINEI